MYEAAKAAALKALNKNLQSLIAQVDAVDAQIIKISGASGKSAKAKRAQVAKAPAKRKRKRERLSTDQLAKIQADIKALLPHKAADAIHVGELREKIKVKDSTIKASLLRLKAKHAGGGKWYL